MAFRQALSKLSVILSSYACCCSGMESHQFVKQVDSYLIIQDCHSACLAGSEALKKFPGDRQVMEALIRAYAGAGLEKEMFNIWENYQKSFSDALEKKDLLEAMAWGIIHNGSKASSHLIRIVSLLGALYGQDAKGIKILRRAMEDSSSLVRAISLELSSHTCDEILCQGVLQVWEKDHSWNVRQAAAKAAGKMKIKEALPKFFAILSNGHSGAEEKLSAIEGIVNILDKINRAELEKLVKSNRVGLRVLACRVVDHFQSYDLSDLIFPLLDDANAEVRAEAITTIGYMKDKSHLGKFVNLLGDSDSTVAIMAAWALLLQDDDRGGAGLKKWLFHENRDIRLFSAAALNATGGHGSKVSADLFYQAHDPYVKMTLALGLLGRRDCIEDAREALYTGITNNRSPIMWFEKAGFKALAPSKVALSEDRINNPEAVNQATRLEILEILAAFRHPTAQEAIREFLKERNWGVAGSASSLMLTEGDEEAAELVKNLLRDSDDKVRLQAALIIAVWSSDEEALNILQELYPGADRENKVRILEVMGKVGEASSLPFLLNTMREPFQTLRIIGAAALLGVLYH